MPKADREVPRDIPQEPPQTAEKRVTLRQPWPLPAVVVAYHITNDGNPDSYPLHIANKVLSDGDSSRIYQKLVYEKQLAVAAFGEANLIEDPNLFYAVAVVQPGRSTDDAINALIAEFDRLKDEPITEHELQRTKNQFARDYILGRESNQQKASQLAHAIVIHRDIKTADGEFDIFQNITVADVQRVAKTYFRPENRLVVTILPVRRSATMKTIAKSVCSVRLWIGSVLCLSMCLSAFVWAQNRDWPSERPPRPLPARDIKFPPYEVRTLPNGLQVVAVLHHEQPAVSMRLLIRTGTASDPVGKLGLVHLLSSLLDQGTTTKSAEELADAVDFIGGAKNTGADPDLSFVNMVVMKDSFETGLRLMADMAEHPAFASEEIERQRLQVLSGLRVNMADPEYIATMVFDRLVYGFHPYGLPDNGTPETTAGLTRNDLVAFHSKYFVPNNAILAVVGDVTTEEAFGTVQKVFGDWQMKRIDKEKVADALGPSRRVIVVDKPDSVQTEVRVGHVGIARNHPDYMALNLAVRILGGEGSNRLHQVLRTQRSLTYGAQAMFDTMKNGGDIVAETNTRSEATGEVLRLIVDEFWRLQRERVSSGELNAAKAYMTGNFPLTIETPDSIAVQVLNAVFYGLPLEQLQTFRERVNAVTVDDIERVARFYLKPDAVSVVLVGNASVFVPQLRGVGFGRYETIPLDNLDLLKSDFKRTGAAGRPSS